MSDGRKYWAEKEAEEQWALDMQRWEAVDSGKRLDRVQKALDHLQRFQEADPALTRRERNHIDEAIVKLKAALGVA